MSIPRRVQRGAPLLPLCEGAHTIKYEFGSSDDRCFCFGVIDSIDDEPLPECVKCGAYVYNAKPMEV